jgi:hypothetical protein
MNQTPYLLPEIMPMNRTPIARARVVVAGLVVFIIACDTGADRGAPPDTRATDTNTLERELDRILGGPVSEVTVDITGCGTETVRVVVDPWVARVVPGRAFSWVASGDMDSMTIRHKDGDWPFPAQLPAGRPGSPIEAGQPQGNGNQRGSYEILVECGGTVLEIDPWIILREPGLTEPTEGDTDLEP